MAEVMVTTCSTCGEEVQDFMWLKCKSVTIALCEPHWQEFVDKAPANVLASLDEVQWNF